MNKHIRIADINALERVRTGTDWKWRIRVIDKWVELPKLVWLFNALKIQALIAKKVGVIAQFDARQWDLHLKFLLENKTRDTVEIDDFAVADFAVKLGAPHERIAEIVDLVEAELKEDIDGDTKHIVFALRKQRPDLFSDVRKFN